MSDNFFDELEQEIAGDKNPFAPTGVIAKEAPRAPKHLPTDRNKSAVAHKKTIISETLDSTPMFADTPKKASKPFHEPRSEKRGERTPRSERSERIERSERPERAERQYNEDSLQSHTYGTLHESRPVFLPSIKAGITRVIPVSLYEKKSAAMSLYQYQDEILLVNFGIEEYKDDMFGAKNSLPDIRFLSSQKDKVKGLVLTSADSLSSPSVKHVLAFLNFPKIYAPVSVIEKMKSAIRSGGLIEKCRFVELPMNADMTIGHFTIRANGVNSILSLSVTSPGAKVLQLIDGTTENLPAADVVFVNGQKQLESLSDIFAQGENVKSWALAYSKAEDMDSVALPATGKVIHLEGGSILEIENGKEVDYQNMKLFLDSILLDGNGIGTASSHVIKARAQMMTGGVIALVFIVDKNSKAILGPIKIETRGLAYLHEAREIHRFIIKTGKNSYEQTIQDIPDIEEKDLIKIIKKDLELALTHKIGRSPMVIPVVITV